MSFDGSSVDSEKVRALQEFPVKFSVQNRMIANVCSHSREAEWILNMKKAALSALQSSVHPSQLNVNVTEVCEQFFARVRMSRFHFASSCRLMWWEPVSLSTPRPPPKYSTQSCDMEKPRIGKPSLWRLALTTKSSFSTLLISPT